MPEKSEQTNAQVDKRLPLVVSAENRDSSANKDAKLVNCYMESGMQKGSYFIYKRAGIVDSLTFIPAIGPAVGRGLYNWLDDIYSVYGATLYKNGTTIGTVDDTGGMYYFNQSLGTPTRMILGNGVVAYTWDGTTLSQIGTSGLLITAGAFVVGTWYAIDTIGTTDFTLIGASVNVIGTIFKATGVGTGDGTAFESSFPTSFVPGFAYLDETTYVMTPDAAIQGSGLNNPDHWSALNVLTAQIEPDLGVALAKQLVFVVAFKQWSTEVFYDAANAEGSPLATVQGAKSAFGCLHADTVQSIDDELIWLATNRNSSPQIVMMSGLKTEVVSTKAIDKLLSKVISSYTFYSFSFKENGHKFYVLTIPSSNVNLTIVFDIVEKAWSLWTDTNGNYFPFVACTFNASGNRLWQHESNGKLYLASSSYTNDDGSIITADIYTPNYDGGTSKKKLLNGILFVADKVTGSNLKVRCSDDDYMSWTNFRNVDLGVNRPYLDRCGSFYRRAYHLRHDGNTKFRISAMELQIELGVL